MVFPGTAYRSSISCCTPTRPRSATAYRTTKTSAPRRSASRIWNLTRKLLMPGCTMRPRSSTPHTSRRTKLRGGSRIRCLVSAMPGAVGPFSSRGRPATCLASEYEDGRPSILRELRAVAILTRSITIDAPVDTVFDFALDISQLWKMKDVELTEVDIKPGGVGTSARLNTHLV